MRITKRRQSGSAAIFPLLFLLAGCVPGVNPELRDSPSENGNPLVISKHEDPISMSISSTSLSWEANDDLILVVVGEWDSYRWFEDAEPQPETGRELTRKASDFSIGSHNITVEVTNTGRPYTRQVNFTVEL
jgi:hypothetical protein